LQQPNKVFFGDDGLRAGWSIAIFLAPFTALYLLFWLAQYYHLVPATPPSTITLTPSLAIFGEGLPFVFIAAAALVMSLIEHRPFSRYGLTLHRLLPDFAAGLCWGILTLSLLIGLLWVTHAIAFDGIALRTGPALTYAVKWAFAFLLVGLFEEFCFRGYLQFTLARGISGVVRTLSPRNAHSHAIGFWIAAFILSGCIFAYTHTSNDGETIPGILAVGCAGTVFVFSLWRTGSLWWAIGFHAAWDWAQSFLYGTPDSGGIIQGHFLATHPVGSKLLSGGSDGPEGSVLVFPVLLLVALIIHLTLPRRDYPLTPDQSPPEQRTPPHPQSTA
jgi:uncharacterized protein